jgi:hypothetical protein
MVGQQGIGQVVSVTTRSPESVVEGESEMLWTIFVILLVLWALGMVTSFTLGGFIHILLVIAIATVLIRIIQGRPPV